VTRAPEAISGDWISGPSIYVGSPLLDPRSAELRRRLRNAPPPEVNSRAEISALRSCWRIGLPSSSLATNHSMISGSSCFMDGHILDGRMRLGQPESRQSRASADGRSRSSRRQRNMTGALRQRSLAGCTAALGRMADLSARLHRSPRSGQELTLASVRYRVGWLTRIARCGAHLPLRLGQSAAHGLSSAMQRLPPCTPSCRMSALRPKATAWCCVGTRTGDTSDTWKSIRLVLVRLWLMAARRPGRLLPSIRKLRPCQAQQPGSGRDIALRCHGRFVQQPALQFRQRHAAIR